MEINLLGVLLSAVSAFLVGGIWYGPLFSKLWMKENGFTEESLKGQSVALAFGGTFVATLISATLMSLMLGRSPELSESLKLALYIGLGWVSCSFATTYLFERKSLKLYLVNAGFHVISFFTIGLVLGLIK